MSDPVGHLAIHYGGQGCRLLDNRPRHPQAVLSGRTVEEAAALLPRLFAVCGVAHTNAFARAVEAARQQTASPEVEDARHRAEQLEVVANHAWRFAITWATALGMAPRLDGLKQARDGQAADDPHMAAAGLRRLLEEEDGPVERMRDQARRLTGTPGLPTCRQPLGWPGAPWWAEAMRRADFIDRPTTLDGRVPAVLPRDADPGPKTGPLGIAAALVAAARQSLVRLCGPRSRVVESYPFDLNAGIGLAETARGPLAYRVHLDGHRVVAAWAVTPTDWLAVPEGALGRAIAALPPGAGQEERLRLLVGLYDPCVPVQLIRTPAEGTAVDPSLAATREAETRAMETGADA